MNEFKSGVWIATLCYVVGSFLLFTRALNEHGFYTIIWIPYLLGTILFLKYFKVYKITWDEEGVKYSPSGKVIHWHEIEKIRLDEISNRSEGFFFSKTRIYIRQEYKSEVKERFGFYGWYFNTPTEIFWLFYKNSKTNHDALTTYWNSISLKHRKMYLLKKT